jgi:predicted dehydrogenase
MHVLTDSLQTDGPFDLEHRYDIRVFTDLGEALETSPDATFVCNPSSLHIPVAMAAAAAGSHLFVEKPLSASLDGVDDLDSLIQRLGLVGLVGYQMRFHPCLQRLRSLLAERAIGSVLSVQATVGENLRDWHPFEDYRRMYAARRDLGGGVILSQIHEIDYLCWLFGPPLTVYTRGGNLGALEIDVEDVASTLMECVVDGRRIPVHLHQDFVQRPPQRTCEVIGTSGRVHVDFRAARIVVRRTEESVAHCEEFAAFERNQMFLDELEHFLACIRGEAEPLVPVREGALSLRVALAARQSIQTDQAVRLS